MEEYDVISTLSDAERKALSICGIVKSEQLLTCSMEALCRDASQAREFFPEDMAALPEERLLAIIRSAGNRQTEPPKLTPAQPTEEGTETADSKPHPQQHKPAASVSDEHHHSAEKKAAEPDGKRRCIHCSHPFGVYMGAWATVLLYIDIVAWVVVPPMLMLEILPEFPAIIVLAILALPIFMYCVLSRAAVCTVCNVKVFSMRSFTLNKHAHNYFLLGRKLSTALHVIFCLWFRCPVCGTPQALLKRKHHRH